MHLLKQLYTEVVSDLWIHNASERKSINLEFNISFFKLNF